jgi:hypothetical protein
MGVLLTVLVILAGFVLVRVVMVATARRHVKHKNQARDAGGGGDHSISLFNHDDHKHSDWGGKQWWR